MRAYVQKKNQSQTSPPSGSTLASAATSASSLRAHPLLHLQRTLGNQEVLRLLRATAEDPRGWGSVTAAHSLTRDFSQPPAPTKPPKEVQAKLEVNTIGDEYEQKAGQVSEQVMKMPEPGRARSSVRFLPISSTPDSIIQRTPEEDFLSYNASSWFYTMLTQRELNWIARGINWVTSGNPNLGEAFFEYYSNHHIRRMNDSEQRNAVATNVDFLTSPGGDTAVRQNFNLLGTPAGEVGSAFLHELSHTRHSSGSITGEREWQEGESYGIDFAVSERSAPGRMNVIIRAMGDPASVDRMRSGIQRDLKIRKYREFVQAYGVMRILNGIIADRSDAGDTEFLVQYMYGRRPFRNPSFRTSPAFRSVFGQNGPIPTRAQELRARELAAQYVAAGPSGEVQTIKQWVLQNRAAFNDVDYVRVINAVSTIWS